MTENHGLAAALDDLEAGTLADVRAVEDDACSIALLHDETAESRESHVSAIEDTVADLIRPVVRRNHHAQAESMHRLDAMQLAFDPIATLGEENERRASVALGGTNVVDLRCHEQVLVLPRYEMPEHHLLDGRFKPVVWLEGCHAVRGHTMPVRGRKVGVRPDLHARIDEDVRVIVLENRMEPAVCARDGSHQLRPP
jgi:hypothetical protein